MALSDEQKIVVSNNLRWLYLEWFLRIMGTVGLGLLVLHLVGVKKSRVLVND